MAACTPERDPSSLYAPQDVDVPVVDAVLVVGQPLPPLLLSRTQPADQEYSFRDAAISDADVRVIVADGDTVRYEETTWYGRYEPIDEMGRLVEPSATYRLRIETTEGELVTAVTTTPAPIEVGEWVLLAGSGNPEDRVLRTFEELGDAVYDAPENQLVYPQGVLETQLQSTPALGYQLALSSLDLDSDFVIDPPFLDDEDLASIERDGSSPVIEPSEGNIRLPWFAVFFEGRHFYLVQSLDQNVFDLVRTTPQSGLGFGGNAGDNFERPIYHVEGGIGVFGSVSRDSVGLTVWPAP